jgi:hypothetical protein
MSRSNADSRLAAIGPVLARAICFGCGAGAVFGGVVGTTDWPVVGTFFGASVGVFVGAGAGIVDGLVLAGVARAGRSVWIARLASGVVSSGFAWIAASRASEFRSLQHVVGQVALVTVCLLLGAAFGPMIAYGVEPISFGRGPTPRPLSQIAARLLLWAAAIGAGLGAMVGLIIGLFAYLPTAPFAAVEGAVLGATSAVVLTLLLGAAALLPRLRMRR